MRLHSVRFKDNSLPLQPGNWTARGELITHLMITYGCYLQKSYDLTNDCLVWTAHYE
jgi:hypothetical protein